MSCNDILDELKKKGIISDEGLKKGDIYPDICDDTVLFQILFEIPTRGIIDLRFREECQ